MEKPSIKYATQAESNDEPSYRLYIYYRRTPMKREFFDAYHYWDEVSAQADEILKDDAVLKVTITEPGSVTTVRKR